MSKKLVIGSVVGVVAAGVLVSVGDVTSARGFRVDVLIWSTSL